MQWKIQSEKKKSKMKIKCISDSYRDVVENIFFNQ